jgi:LytS/YehU family sensor histidine kinase
VVPLAEELELLERYLEIQRARFGTRLHIERKIAPQALSASVPVLLLQPLVENAVRHGLDESDAAVTITIEAGLDGERLRLAVRDDAPVAAVGTSGEGIGLANTRQRLATLYGEDFGFTAGRRAGGGFAVDFVLPFQPGGVSPGNP